ncbi:hypothetical protein ROTAS13_03062 [Roseomonas sp. TAS13]|nr:hypothetical protein ROTAS13_03062 [Roseomonas sp. TAS13]
MAGAVQRAEQEPEEGGVPHAEAARAGKHRAAGVPAPVAVPVGAAIGAARGGGAAGVPVAAPGAPPATPLAATLVPNGGPTGGPTGGRDRRGDAAAGLAFAHPAQGVTGGLPVVGAVGGRAAHAGDAAEARIGAGIAAAGRGAGGGRVAAEGRGARRGAGIAGARIAAAGTRRARPGQGLRRRKGEQEAGKGGGQEARADLPETGHAAMHRRSGARRRGGNENVTRRSGRRLRRHPAQGPLPRRGESLSGSSRPPRRTGRSG